jgi:beta-fructofuranosidase/levanase/fructan beta-fructosidase
MKYLAIFFLLLFGCVAKKKDQLTVSENFTEKHRPQYHFTPPSQWMNDPNGMVYYEGEYHLFYQYYPDSNVWGPMHWGHAISKDMISWEHLPIALYPDDLGYIFSGSAVVDWKNTSGLGTEENPPLIAIFTYHDPKGWESGAIDFQTQGMAFSLDKGRTWTKYENNPVLPNPGIADFRDPKVTWHEPSQKWIMTLAVWDHVSFYSSPNLIDWEKESDFGLEWGSHAGVWECPDLFEMRVEGSEEKRWVLLVSINPGGPQGGSATQYFIGDFDGTFFTLDSSFINDLGTLEAYEPEGEVFEDFESGYENWVVSGSAFGDQPAKGAIGNQNPVEGYEGKGLVNSFNGGDASTGTLTSNEFVIEKPYINLKVGGGNDNNATYVALVVDGKEVRKAVGSNAEQLKIKSWNVSDLVGRNASIKIVDNHKAGWGHK